MSHAILNSGLLFLFTMFTAIMRLISSNIRKIGIKKVDKNIMGRTIAQIWINISMLTAKSLLDRILPSFPKSGPPFF